MQPDEVASRLMHDPFLPLSSLGLDQSWLDANRSKLMVALQASKYWSNTIEALSRSGHMDAIIYDRYAYPHRIGLFPGLSCMFYCGFCGRNKDAAYDRSAVDRGIAIYKQVMSDAPKDGEHWRDRFRISGGQEPLTNPRLGELISHGADIGLKMGIYTNGYMLTPQYMTKQTGMFSSDYIRVSLYGHDDESYEQTTKKRGSWSVVRKNLVDWSKQDGTKRIRLGFNWIILPGKISDLMKMIKALISLQDEMSRPIDFITVREDFSQDLICINDSERHQLIDIMAEVKDYTDRYMPTTKIDYGYALEPLSRSTIVGPLRMAKHDQLDGKGMPQASVQVDILGNVYAYHETAFLDRPGSQRFIIGNAAQGIEDLVRAHLAYPDRFRYIPSDTEMLDAFDHAVSLATWAARVDLSNGFTASLWQ